MALFNGFTFDGVNSLDYGIYITGEGVYNAPERAVEMVEIQGRNGALAIDQGRWDNIEVTYHCGCFGADQADFAERIGRFRNAICSRTSYCRLTDDYHPDEYRLALYHAGVEVDHVRRAGEFDLIFDCKPQRFLTSGEDTITVGDWGDATEYSGDIVSFEGDEMTAVKSLSVSLSPVQNLNGYDHPWVGGAGKNKLDTSGIDGTVAGVTYKPDANGIVTINGTKYGNSYAPFTNASITLKGGVQYTFSIRLVSGTIRDDTGTGLRSLQCYLTTSGGTNIVSLSGVNENSKTASGLISPTEDTTAYVRFAWWSDNTIITNAVIEMQVEVGSTATAYEPYENICPITGWDEVSVPVAGKNLLNPSGFQSQSNVSINDGVITATADDTLLPFSPVLQAYNNSTFVRNLSVGTPSNPFQFTKDETFNRLVFGHNGQARDVKVKMDVSDLPDGTYLFSWRTLSDVNRISWDNMMIRLASDTDNTYEPYQGTTYTQEFKDSQGNTLTVYGGEDEIVGGVLTVTHKKLLVNSSMSGIYGYVSAYGGVRINVSDANFSGTPATDLLSNNMFLCTARGANENPDQTFKIKYYTSASDNKIVVFCGSWTSTAEFNAWTAENETYIIYPLATPITYTLTPQQVETLIGTNNIWSDAGEVTVEIADDPNKIVNPTLYDARPLIKVSGYGTVQVGSVTITIEGSASDVTYIDCDSMECYRLNGLAIVSANSAVSFSSYDFPVLEADAITGITYSTNISQVQIVPRWWQL